MQANRLSKVQKLIWSRNVSALDTDTFVAGDHEALLQLAYITVSTWVLFGEAEADAYCGACQVVGHSL